MSTVFEYIKKNIRISSVVGSYVSLKGRGNRYTGLCPFHGEKTPSFHVDDEKGLYYCFGCKASGDVISFVCEMEKLDPIDSCRFLAKKYGMDISGHLFSGKKQDQKVYDVLRDAAERYVHYFWKSDIARRYAKNRGLNREAIRAFVIGYAPDDWQTLYRDLRKKYSDSLLLKAGLVGEKNGRYYDRFRNRLMFPIIDQVGKIVGFGGRALGNDPAKYLNSSDSDHFKKGELLYALNQCKDYLGEKPYIILAEGYMDVVSLSIAGIRNVVATLGTSMTEGHAKLLKRYTDEVIICYDSDSAGIRAAFRAADILEPMMKRVRICMLGEGLDPDEYRRKYGAEELLMAVESSKRAVKFKIDQLSLSYDLNDTGAFNGFLKAACREINKTRDPFDRNTYAQYLVDEYRADPNIIGKVIDAGTLKKTVETENEEKGLTVEEQLIKSFVRNYRTISEDEERFAKFLRVEFSADISPIFYGLINYFEEHDELDYSLIVDEIGLDFTKKLQIILENKEEPQDMDILLLNYELSVINEKLRKGASAEEFQELSILKRNMIREIKTIGERSSS